MLYLMIKKENDYLMLDIPGHGEVKIVVADCGNKVAKLGIEFPATMGAWRKAVWERMQGEKELNEKWKITPVDRPKLTLKRAV